MREHPSVARFARLAAALALLAVLALQVAGSPARGALQDGTRAETHRDSPRVAFLFGSGSTTGGRFVTLRVELTAPAPAGGAEVALASERPDVVPLPASVTVPAGQTQETVRVETVAVEQTVHVRVSAAYGGTTRGREVLVKEPDLRVLYAQTVIRGGGQGKLTVCLTGEAYAGGVVVTLASSDPATLAVPATATIAAGRACVSVNAAAAEVTTDTAVRVTAGFDGATVADDTIVRDFPVPVSPTVTATSTATATATPVPAAVSITVLGGVPVASGGVVTFEVCLTAGGAAPYTVDFDSSASGKATADAEAATLEAVGECEETTLTDVVGGTGATGGQARLQVLLDGAVIAESGNILFPGDPPTPTATSTSTATATATSTTTSTATATNTATATSTPTATGTVGTT
jgi:hypothetical protein